LPHRQGINPASKKLDTDVIRRTEPVSNLFLKNTNGTHLRRSRSSEAIGDFARFLRRCRGNTPLHPKTSSNRLWSYFTLLRVRRQRVHILTLLRCPLTIMVTVWTFGSQRRLVRRLEWLTLCPNWGALPQISHLAIIHLFSVSGLDSSTRRFGLNAPSMIP